MSKLFTAITLLAIFALVSSVHASGKQLQKLTMSRLKELRQLSDNVHYFVIIDQKLAEQIQSFPQSTSNIKYMVSDCQDKILTGCDPSKHSPIVLIYNKVVIDYEVHNQDFYDGDWESYKNGVVEWVSSAIKAAPYVDPSFEMVQHILKEHSNIVVMAENKTVKDQEAAFKILAKQFPFQKMVFLRDPSTIEELNLSEGQFVGLLQNGTKIGHYSESFPHRYDIWKRFMLDLLFPNIPNINAEITNNRLGAHQNRGIVVCDLSTECWKFWTKIQSQMEEDPSRKAMRIIKNQDTLKNIKLLELYFHIKLTSLKLPFVLVISGEDPKVKNLPARYVRSLSADEPYLDQISSLYERIDLGEEPNYQLSSGIPKKQGFYGKGSQKFVQKLSYETFWSEIKSANQKGKSYLVLMTAFSFDCKQCEAFYSDFKKIAAFLHAEDRQDVVLGVHDLSKDQLPYNFDGIPLLLLIKPNGEEIKYQRRMDFEQVLRFINDNTIKQKVTNEDL